MRLLVAMLLCCAAACVVACADEPTPEYAKAKAAYAAAFADTADVTYKGARWDEVLALLKAVPASNAKEQRLAQQLVSDIEGTRARIAATLRASDANAEKLLDIKSLPPLDLSPKETKATEKDRIVDARTCINACKTSFEACMKSAGCVASETKAGEGKTSVSFGCPRDTQPKAVACNNTFNTCSGACR